MKNERILKDMSEVALHKGGVKIRTLMCEESIYALVNGDSGLASSTKKRLGCLVINTQRGGKKATFIVKKRYFTPHKVSEYKLIEPPYPSVAM